MVNGEDEILIPGMKTYLNITNRLDHQIGEISNLAKQLVAETNEPLAFIEIVTMYGHTMDFDLQRICPCTNDDCKWKAALTVSQLLTRCIFIGAGIDC
jgi:hypothetical protein